MPQPEARDARVLILDYSMDRSEAALFRRGIPEGIPTEAVFVRSGEDVPDPSGFTHVMHSGSSLSICRDAPFLPEAGALIERLASEGVPQLGICYGHQLLCRILVGPGAVRKAPGGLEMGWCGVAQPGDPPEVPEAGRHFTVLQSHFDEVVEVPGGSEIAMTGGGSRIQGFVHRGMKLFGMQFHPEFDREEGNRMFLRERRLAEENGLDVDEIVAGGPSIDSGRIFFGHFLDRFAP